MTAGKFTKLFFSSPSALSWHEFLGIGFVIIALAVLWGGFVNDLA